MPLSPIIAVPTREASLLAINAIEAAGWDMGWGTIEDARRSLERGAYDHCTHVARLIERGMANNYIGWVNLTYFRPGSYLILNSPAHFVAYCRAHNLIQPRA